MPGGASTPNVDNRPGLYALLGYDLAMQAVAVAAEVVVTQIVAAQSASDEHADQEHEGRNRDDHRPLFWVVLVAHDTP